MSTTPGIDCPLCQNDGGELVWRDDKLRVIRAAEPLYPAWYRVVWNEHVKEFSQLSRTDRAHCMDVVNVVEQVLLETLRPTKVNLAQFGNMVAHLHWHVIARFDWDSHFPNPAWGAASRQPDPALIETLGLKQGQICQNLSHRLGSMPD